MISEDYDEEDKVLDSPISKGKNTTINDDLL